MTAPSLSPRRLTSRSGALPDRLFRTTTGIAALVVAVLILAIGGLLLVNSREAFERFGPGFVIGTTWDPVAGIYGALPYIVGTLLSSLIALVVAAPIGILTAIFLAELAPRRLSIPLTFLIELLAAIPSVVFGLWGVFVLSPFLGSTLEPFLIRTLGWIPVFAGPSYGIGLFSAGIILAIMILPTIVAISREVISSVPDSQREAMAALGATRWETVRRAVLPFARSGIVGAVILGLGRALGETMAVTMVIGNGQNIPTRLFDQSQTIASKIATTFNEASIGLQTSSLIALGLILLVITIGLNVVARLLVRRVATNGTRS
ncbi:MAG TPA: phosphate ABC transporter permease subunit PstC [Candidatus Deferrimicrobium sp.]|nr:phosphate ABC transporter permease subunit PstC [Candidatus Deferrimicrobium sp.]